MRVLIAFIVAFFVSSLTPMQACGVHYFMEGADAVRMCFVKPYLFHKYDYVPFTYTASYFNGFGGTSLEHFQRDSIHSSVAQNIALWRKRCKNIPSATDTYWALYESEKEIFEEDSENSFIRYLYANKDEEAIEYLKFIQKYASLNNLNVEDPWERNRGYGNLQNNLIQAIKDKLTIIKDEDLKQRYAFIAIRISYYSGDVKTLKALYKSHFTNKTEKNILTYWAMYYHAWVLDNDARQNVEAALLLEHASDKLYGIRGLYDHAMPMDSALAVAKNDAERAAVWAFETYRNPAKGLDGLRKSYALNPSATMLSFLLIREINKLEDWILTPYYTDYAPALSRYYWKEGDYEKSLSNENRIKRDRGYARELLAFVKSIDSSQVENPMAWQVAEAYLYFLVEDYKTALLKLETLQEPLMPEMVLYEQLSILKALANIHLQPYGKAAIPVSIQQLLMEASESKNYKLLFAIARELEYKGNTTDAALLLSKINRGDDYYEDGERAFWRSKRNRVSTYWNFYYNYFFYLDAEYSAAQMETLIASIKAKEKSHDGFTLWLYSSLKADEMRLYDLLGTKYIRNNQLKKALVTFEQVDTSLWFSDKYPYKTFLNANPFYTNFYMEHKKSKADTIVFTKTSITRQLIEYLEKAEDPFNQDRDYYYFLAAQCYFNMTQYGNSWMMHRYYWSNYDINANLEDDEDYYGCRLAQQHYQMAYNFAKGKKFKILCQAMVARCENYRLKNRLNSKRWSSPGWSWAEYERQLEKLDEKNSAYNQLMKNNPKDYEELRSNCYAFDQYLATRMK